MPSLTIRRNTIFSTSPVHRRRKPVLARRLLFFLFLLELSPRVGRFNRPSLAERVRAYTTVGAAASLFHTRARTHASSRCVDVVRAPYQYRSKETKLSLARRCISYAYAKRERLARKHTHTHTSHIKCFFTSSYVQSHLRTRVYKERTIGWTGYYVCTYINDPRERVRRRSGTRLLNNASRTECAYRRFSHGKVTNFYRETDVVTAPRHRGRSYFFIPKPLSMWVLPTFPESFIA